MATIAAWIGWHSGNETACRDLIGSRFPGDEDQGAAAMLLADGTVVDGAAPWYKGSSELCHETEPYCASDSVCASSPRSACTGDRADAPSS